MRELLHDIAIALLVCLVITLCSCSRKVTQTTENVTAGHTLETATGMERVETGSSDKQEWWEATTIEQSYSAPDSTGIQYITKVVTTEARGGKIMHDTIYIHEADSSYERERDTIYYSFDKAESISRGKSYNSYILTIFVILLFLLGGYTYLKFMVRKR